MSATAGDLVAACGGLPAVSLDLAATVIAELRNRNFVPPASWESGANSSTDKRLRALPGGAFSQQRREVRLPGGSMVAGMMGPPPPSMACFSSLAALYQADLRDLAAAVLWLGCAEKLESPVPQLSMFEIQQRLKGAIPEFAPAYWSKRSPHPSNAARHVLYEGIQVLQFNRLVLWRFVDANAKEEITLTRTGRAAILSGDIKAYLVR